VPITGQYRIASRTASCIRSGAVLTVCSCWGCCIRASNVDPAMIAGSVKVLIMSTKVGRISCGARLPVAGQPLWVKCDSSDPSGVVVTRSASGRTASAASAAACRAVRVRSGSSVGLSNPAIICRDQRASVSGSTASRPVIRPSAAAVVGRK